MNVSDTSGKVSVRIATGATGGSASGDVPTSGARCVETFDHNCPAWSTPLDEATDRPPCSCAHQQVGRYRIGPRGIEHVSPLIQVPAVARVPRHEAGLGWIADDLAGDRAFVRGSSFGEVPHQDVRWG